MIGLYDLQKKMRRPFRVLAGILSLLFALAFLNALLTIKSGNSYPWFNLFLSTWLTAEFGSMCMRGKGILFGRKTSIQPKHEETNEE